MSSESKLRSNPRCYLAADGEWPDGPLEDGAPPEASLSQAITWRLREALGRHMGTRGDVAAEACLSPATIYKLLRGTSWGRVPTIARLERVLGARLWGNEHLCHPPRFSITSGEWPDGRLDTKAPPVARLARAVVLRLEQRLEQEHGSRNLEYVARKANVSVLTLRDLCNGTFWGDLDTIARLERFLGIRLWGDEHQKRSSFPPRGYLDVGVWPEGRLKGDAPPKARLAQAMVLRLHIACSKSSPEKVAQQAGIPLSVVQDFLDGAIWPDFAVVVRLDTAGIVLWGSENRQHVRERTIKETKREENRRSRLR